MACIQAFYGRPAVSARSGRRGNHFPARRLVCATLLLLGVADAASVIWFPPGISTVRGIKIGWSDNQDPGMATSGPGRHAELYSALKFAYLDINGIDDNQIAGELTKLAASTGHPELNNVPFVTHGMSYTSGHAIGFFKAMKARNLATAVVHLTASVHDDDSLTRATPIFLKTNTQDFMEDEIQNALSAVPKGFRQFVIVGSGGHEYGDVELVTYPMYTQCFLLRYPDYYDPKSGPPSLKTIPWDAGWLGFADDGFMAEAGPKIAAAGGYAGNLYNTLWFPNKYMACVWRSYMSRGSAVSLMTPTMRDNRFANGYDYGTTLEVSCGTPTKAFDKVELYDGDILLKSFTAAPFSVSPSDLAPGAHAFYAAVYLKDGTVECSRPAIASVRGTMVDARIIKPASWARIVKGTGVTLEAETWSWNSATIAEVEFFDGGVSLGKATSKPFALAWTPTVMGEHVVNAVAKNSAGVTTTSWPVTYAVIESPVATSVQVSPALALVKPGAAQDFTAIVRDQYGHALAQQPTVNWSATGGAIAGGTFTAQQQVGSDFAVTAAAGTATGKATVHVTNTLRFKFGPYGYGFDGFIGEFGGTFAAREAGLSYGWDSSPRHGRARRVDPYTTGDFTTHIPMCSQLTPPWNKTYKRYLWELALPNGQYTVKIGAGDPVNRYDIGQGVPGSFTAVTTQFIHKITAEDQVVMDDTGYLGDPLITKSKVIDVADGRLTIKRGWTEADDSVGTAGMSSDNAFRYMRAHTVKICFVEVSPVGEPSPIGVSEYQRAAAGTPAYRIVATGNRILVRGTAPMTGHVAVYDAAGRAVVRGTLRSGRSVALDSSRLGRGAYVVRLLSDDGTARSGRIVLK